MIAFTFGVPHWISGGLGMAQSHHKGLFIVMHQVFRTIQSYQFVALAVVSLLTLLTVTTVGSGKAFAISSKYGCVKVTAQSLNIRSKNSLRRGEVLGVARRGEVLAKRGPTCPIRRYWCPVRNAAGVEGWAAKKFINNTKCR